MQATRDLPTRGSAVPVQCATTREGSHAPPATGNSGLRAALLPRQPAAQLHPAYRGLTPPPPGSFHQLPPPLSSLGHPQQLQPQSQLQQLQPSAAAAAEANHYNPPPYNQQQLQQAPPAGMYDQHTAHLMLYGMQQQLPIHAASEPRVGGGGDGTAEATPPPSVLLGGPGGSPPRPASTAQAAMSFLMQRPAAVGLEQKAAQRLLPCPNPGCNPAHPGSRDALMTYLDVTDPLLQVRRSTYHEVVQLADVDELLDLEGVQLYTINHARVVFLRPRPQARAPKGAAMPSKCVVDGRQLMDAGADYCSLRPRLRALLVFVSPVQLIVQDALQQQPSKRLRTAPHEDVSSSGDTDLLQMLPPELLLVVVGNLTPRECQPLRLTCKGLRDVVDSAVADTLTVTNDIAQYLVLEQSKQFEQGGASVSNGWVARFLAKFPRIKKLDVKCSQSVLTLFARHMVRDSLGSVPQGALPLGRIFDLAENVKTNSRRHSAVLLCELIKFKVAQSLTSKPPGYDAMRNDVKQYIRADQLLTEHRLELQQRVIELVEKVLTLKGHVDARAHENYKYARDTLDDSLLQLVSCLQARHSKYAYQLLAKAADPAKAARGWRWLFYFLARQKQAEAAIEAYKVVDKQALAQLSPTCLSELFRSLIDNEIITQPEPKLRAITSESGSWTKFLYRGNFNLTSTQSREGALEKVAADLIGKDYLDTAVNVMNRFETDSTANDIWVQLLGALGIVPGGEMPLVSKDLHKNVTDNATRAAWFASHAAQPRRVNCFIPIIDLLVTEGHLKDAFNIVRQYPEQGALDKHLLRALSTAFALADCPPAQLSDATCDLLHDVLLGQLRDVAARSELTTILVAAYAARGNLDKATTWLLGPADEDCGPEPQPQPLAAAAGACAGDAKAGAGSAGPSCSRPAAGASDGASAPDAAAGAPTSSQGGQAAAAAAAAPPAPSTVWQRVCGQLLRSLRRPALESLLMQLLGERRRGLGGHTDQRALLESTARAMMNSGRTSSCRSCWRRARHRPRPPPSRPALLTDVLSTLTEAGRVAEAVQVLRALRGGENDGPLLPPPMPLPAIQPMAGLDTLARRAMDRGRDLEVALQAGWLLSEATPQDVKLAYTHRDLAQKCVGQGMLEAAQMCLLRIKPANWEVAGDTTARELMRAVARSGDKTAAMQLAAVWIHAEDQRADFVKVLRNIRPTTGGAAGAAGGSRAGSSSRGSSR
eukprot:XP_001699849.1 predicted protein [Chlamydomonas reinhardtii]